MCVRIGGKSKRESKNENKKSIQRLQWLLYGLGPGGFPRPPRKDTCIQPLTGEVKAVGEGSRTGYKICHIKGIFGHFGQFSRLK